jgi:hypothetical protein
MRYLLIVGFNCDVYRQEPRARILVGNNLIDEFNIAHYKDTLPTATEKFFKNRHVLQPHSTTQNIQIKNFPPLKFYEIEIDNTLNKVELRIEIENNDCNYNNGFITNSTMIQLRVCTFFPLNQKLLSKLIKIKEKKRLSQNYAWYYSKKQMLFNLLNFICIKQKKKFKTVEFTSDNDISFINFGGDVVFTCELFKKYKILVNKIKKTYRYNMQSIYINFFINKYKQHENQRNTD